MLGTCPPISGSSGSIDSLYCLLTLITRGGVLLSKVNKFHYVFHYDLISSCLSVFLSLFRFSRGSLYLEIAKLFSTVHSHHPVVIFSHYTHVKPNSYRTLGCPPRTKHQIPSPSLCCRCVFEVQIWPLGSGGPVAVQE